MASGHKLFTNENETSLTVWNYQLRQSVVETEKIVESV